MEVRRATKERKLSLSTSFLWVTFLLLILSGCNEYETCEPCKDPTPGPINPSKEVTFKDIKVEILDVYCLSCHNKNVTLGGYSVSNYESAMSGVVPGKPEISKLCTVLEEDQMPPGGGLDPSIAERVCEWILNGALES